MPEISRFFGIVIRMHLSDHVPPHFHAHYGSTWAKVRLEPVGVLKSNLPPRALRLVVEWANLHERELLECWRLIRLNEAPLRIAPLE
jgi:hypothetical protein